MTPKPIHATFAMSLSSSKARDAEGVRPLAPTEAGNGSGRGEGSDPLHSRRDYYRMAGRLSVGIEGRRGQRYSTGALRYGASLALSEEVGTPMMAAPSRAAAAVTA